MSGASDKTPKPEVINEGATETGETSNSKKGEISDLKKGNAESSSDWNEPKPSTSRCLVPESYAGSSSEDEEYWMTDPMAVHYEQDAGLAGDDFSIAATGYGAQPFKEQSLKNVPCKFYDGLSAGCWKGATCPYGHEKYTGGAFAKLHPRYNYAASLDHATTSVRRIPSKPILTRESELTAVVCHVVSPSEFYIRLENEEDCKCYCTKLNDLIRRFEEEEQTANLPKPGTNGMEAYEYGFSGLELPEGIEGSEKPTVVSEISFEERLHKYLSSQPHMRAKLKSDVYVPLAELISVFAEGMWRRAIVIAAIPKAPTETFGRYRVQLLDTGKKLTVTTKDMCRVPKSLTYYDMTHAQAFKCCLFGVSPSWAVWSKNAIQAFTDLVFQKRVGIVIKSRQTIGCPIFEQVPYLVKLTIAREEKVVNVSRELIELGYGLEWHPSPYRPFISKVMDMKGFDFLHRPNPATLSQNALETENRRLAWQAVVDGYEDLDSDDDPVSDHESISQSSADMRLRFRSNQLENIIVNREIRNGYGRGNNPFSSQAFGGVLPTRCDHPSCPARSAALDPSSCTTDENGNTIVATPGLNIPARIIANAPVGTIENIRARIVENVPVGTIENIRARIIENAQNGAVNPIGNFLSRILENAPIAPIENIPARIIENADAGTIENADAGTIENADAGTIDNADAGTIENADAGTIENPAGGINENHAAGINENPDEAAADPPDNGANSERVGPAKLCLHAVAYSMVDSDSDWDE